MFDLDMWAKLATVGSFMVSVVGLVMSILGSLALRRAVERIDQLPVKRVASGTSVTESSQTPAANNYALFTIATQRRLYQFAQYFLRGLGALMLTGAMLGGLALLIINTMTTSTIRPTGGNIQQKGTSCVTNKAGSICSDYQRWTLPSPTDIIETTYRRIGDQTEEGTTSFYLLIQGCDRRAKIDWKLMEGSLVLNEGRKSSATIGGGPVQTDVPPGQEFRFVAERADDEDCVVTLELSKFKFTENL